MRPPVAPVTPVAVLIAAPFSVIPVVMGSLSPPSITLARVVLLLIPVVVAVFCTIVFTIVILSVSAITVSTVPPIVFHAIMVLVTTTMVVMTSSSSPITARGATSMTVATTVAVKPFARVIHHAIQRTGVLPSISGAGGGAMIGTCSTPIFMQGRAVCALRSVVVGASYTLFVERRAVVHSQVACFGSVAGAAYMAITLPFISSGFLGLVVVR